MLKEITGIDYALKIITALQSSKGGEYDSKRLHNLVGAQEVSLSYLQKILPRLVRCGILASSTNGYMLAKNMDCIMISQLLMLCDMPDKNSPSYGLCKLIQTICDDIPVTKVFEK